MADLSFLAKDFLMTMPRGKTNFGFVCMPKSMGCVVADSYYRGDEILKTSVAEFYDENMLFFLNTITELRNPVSEHVLGVIEDESLVHQTTEYILSKLMPLGCFTQAHTSWVNPASIYGGDVGDCDGIARASEHPLPEVQKLFENLYYKSKTGNSAWQSYKEKILRREQIANSLCAGFVPKAEAESVQLLDNDSGSIENNVLAEMLYPYVMHPMDQLRVLVSALPNEIKDNIISSYEPVTIEGVKILCSESDYGYSLAFDIVADFLTYARFMEYENPYPSHIQRQFWTPFFEFELPSVVADLDNKYMSKIRECAERSRRLYTEILRTGLGYVAQYAVLCGYRGRFTVSGNIGAVADYVKYL